MVDAVIGFLWADVAGTAAFLGKGKQGEEVKEGLSVSKGARLTKFEDGYGIASPVTDAQFAGYCRAFGFDEKDSKLATLAGEQVKQSLNFDDMKLILQQAFHSCQLLSLLVLW